MKTNTTACCHETNLPCGGHELPALFYAPIGGVLTPVRLVVGHEEVQRYNLRHEDNGTFTTLVRDAMCWVCEDRVVEDGRSTLDAVA